MRNKIFIMLGFLMLGLLGLGLIPNSPVFLANWALISFLFLGLVIIAFFASFELRNPSAKEITLIATMSALGAASRVPFAMIPGVQPMTFLVMITGWVFGVRTGFVVGAIAALTSNIFLGQGPWTPWQMFCWGMSGVSAALLAGDNKRFNLLRFTLLATAWGYLFGWIMNIWHWAGFIYPLNWKTFLATYMASFPLDTFHALGNLAFSLTFGATFYHILVRFKNKITITEIESK